MSRMSLLGAALLFVLTTTGAQAASITYTMTFQPGSAFSVWATVSQGDNAGLATFGLPLVGNITSIVNESPLAQFAVGPLGSGPIGFSEFRTPNATPNGPTTVTGAQLAIPFPTPYLTYGFGQTAGELGGPGISLFGTTVNPVYGAPLLLATGTYEGELPDFNFSSLDLTAALFIDNSSSAVLIAQVFTQRIIPEPSALILAVMGLIGLCLVRLKLA